MHFAGASHIDLSSVTTPGVTINRNIENLNPAAQLGLSDVYAAKLNIGNASLTVGGTLTAGMSTIDGGFSTNAFIFTNSLQVSKNLAILPTPPNSSGVIYWTSAVSGEYMFVTTQASTVQTSANIFQINASTGAIINTVVLPGDVLTPVIGTGSNVYIGDTQGSTSNVYIFSPELQLSGNLSSYAFENQTGIVTDPTGAIYIAESVTGSIVKYASESDTNPTVLSVGFPATALAIDSLLYLYTTDGDYNIFKLNQAGHVVTSFNSLQNAAIYGLSLSSIAVDTYFRVYVSDPKSNKIYVFFPDGSFGYDIPGDNTYELASISINNNNDLYVLHYYGRILKNKIISETSDRVYTNSDTIRTSDLTSTNAITANTLTFSNVSNTQNITYSGQSLFTGPLGLNTTQASLDGVYTLQVSDSELTTSGPYAMTVLNRSEFSPPVGSGYFHTEFVNTPGPDSGINNYGVGFGFLSDGRKLGGESFVIAPHGSGFYAINQGFDDTRNSDYNQPAAISIDTADKIGYVGIYGMNYPQKPLDVNGDAIIRGDLTVTGSMALGNVLTGYTASRPLLASDYYIGLNGVGIVITLPPMNSIVVGKQIIIKDESGNALLNPITIITSDYTQIDGSSSVTITQNFASLTLLWTGALWSII